MFTETFEVDDISLYKRVCGYKDKNLKQVENILGITLIPRGNTVIIQSEIDAAKGLEVLHAFKD